MRSSSLFVKLVFPFRKPINQHFWWCLSFLWSYTEEFLGCMVQGCRKQSVDGQAQLDVSGKAANKSRAKCAAKIMNLAIFSSQEALSLHFSFKLGVRKGNDTNCWEVWKFNHTEHKPYACALTYVLCRNLRQQLSQGMRPHRSWNYVSLFGWEYGPAMAGPAGPVPAPMWLW